MIQRGAVVTALGLAMLAGCDYSAPEPLPELDAIPIRTSAGSTAGDEAVVGRASSSALRADDQRSAILESSITLIQRAALKPGGDNFKLAVQKLNHYFDGTSLADYQLDPAAFNYLSTQLPPQLVQELQNRNWSLRDARHLEDCMMYYGIANRIAGTGENLTRVRRVFDWVVHQVQLVPAGLLGTNQLAQVPARPYDVLLRGLATESAGYWAERSWLFMALCRQLGLDSGLVAYSRSQSLDSLIPRYIAATEFEADLLHLRRGTKPPLIWICTVLIDGKAYLFDARLGMEIPGPDGKGVATIDQAMADPVILERMNLPGESPYGTSRASLLGSPTKIAIFIDSSQGYFSPKMRLLQRELGGKNRTILYRDPADERDRFQDALGGHFGGLTLWALPLEVETRLFTDPQFVASIQSSLILFRPEFPLVYARVKQLRGESDQAVQDYVKLRFSEDAPLVTDKHKTIPKEIQDGLDVYATYYLALIHLERDHLDQAELMFRQILDMLPEPGPNQPYYNMFRWGANANLASILEARHDRRGALAYYLAPDPTSQQVGKLLRARQIVLDDPMGPAPPALPPAPPPKPATPRPATGQPRPPAGR